jgi:DNA-binding HxlR family transcriptional regulator
MSSGNCKGISKELLDGIKALGDVWSLSILGTLAENEGRFCEIQRALGGVNPTTLTDRLKRLEKEKLILRKEETVDKLSVVYALSEKGRGILPVLKEIQVFADKYL